MNRSVSARESGSIRAMLFAAAVVAAFLAAAIGHAQSAPPPEAPSAVVPKEAYIPTSEVAGRAEQTDRELEEIESIAQRTPAVTAIIEALDSTNDDLTLRAREDLVRISGISRVQALEDIENRWRSELARLEAWRTTLTSQARLMDRQTEHLEELDALWKRTLVRTQSGDAPKSVIERIKDRRNAIRDTTRLVSQRRTEILDLQSQTSSLSRTTRDVLSSVSETRDALRSELLRFDALPLWTVIAEGPVSQGIIDQEFEVLRQDLSHARDYAAENILTIAIHLIFTLGIAALGLIVLPRRDDEEEAHSEDDSDRAAALVLSHPFSSAFLISYMFVPFFYAVAPSFFTGLVGLAMLAPILRVIPQLLEPAARPSFYSIVIFFVIDRLRELIAPLPGVERIVFTLQMGAAVFVFARLARPAGLALITRHPTGVRLTALLISLAVVLLAGSLVASAVGSVALGDLLGEAVLTATYEALAIYAVYRVLCSVSAALLRSPVASRLNMVKRHRLLLLRRTSTVLRFASYAAWLGGALEAFTLRDGVQESVVAVLSARLSVGELSISLGDGVAFILVLGITLGFSRLLRFVLEEDVLPRMRLPRGVPYAVTSTIHYSILFVGVLGAIAATGIDLGRFSILAGALGVGVGFGLQNIVNNFVSGLVLLFERPIQTGDVVEAGSLLGVVRRIGIRASTLRTMDGAEVIVPNANLISEQVVNWTLSDRQRRIEVSVGVKYGTDPEQVVELLRRVAREHPNILDNPEPDGLFLGFGDSSLDFQLRGWTGDFERWVYVRSELNVAVNRALADAGIEIPFPQRDLHLRSVSEGVGERLQGSSKQGGASDPGKSRETAVDTPEEPEVG